MKREPIKVLQVQIGGTTFSGVASYLYQYYTHMDHSVVHYDFLFCRDNSMNLVMGNESLSDSRFFILNAKKGTSNDYLMITKGVHGILKKNKYDIVVVNTSIVAVIFACLLGMVGINGTKFIAHAHNTELVLSKSSVRAKLLPITRIVDQLLRLIIRSRSDYLFSCSEDAATYTFGSKVNKMSNAAIVTNAIDTRLFSFDPKVRKEIREVLGTDNNMCVYGNVGSFCKRKNQTFLLQVFRKVNSTNPNTELWLVGDGQDREKIEKLAQELNISESIKFLGQREDVNRIMQGMDCFVFPSLSEGLGIVAIEAQASGLPTIVSDGVPDDVLITELANKIRLSDGIEKWANALSKSSCCKRWSRGEDVKNAGYDIRMEAQKITELFCRIADK